MVLWPLSTFEQFLSVPRTTPPHTTTVAKPMHTLLLLVVLTLASAQDFTKDVREGPGTFENIVPDGWFKNGEETDEGKSASTGNVLFMTDGHWDAYRRDTERFLVFFHASDCKWCTYSKPGFSEASRKFRRSMPFLAIDCKGAGSGTCAKLGLVSFPRLQYFQKDEKEPEDPKYFENGPKDSGAFVTYVESKLDEAERKQFGLIGDNIDVTKMLNSDVDISKLKKMRVKVLRKMLKERGQRCVGCTDKSEYVKRVKESLHLPVLTVQEQKQHAGGAVGATGKKRKRKRKSLMQEKREKILRKKAAVGWSQEEHGNGNVIHSYDGHFQELYLSKQASAGGSVGGGSVGGGGIDATSGRTPGALVFFYAPWCKHCVQYKPKMVALSNELKNEKHNGQFDHLDILAIDGDASKELAHKYKLTIFPTFYFFRNGKLDMTLFDQEGRPREPKDLMKFFHRLENPNWMPTPDEAFTNVMRWGSEATKVEKDNGDVIFLTQEHWSSYRSGGHMDQGAMVLFYTEWCHHCKDLKPHYAQVSRLLKEQGMPDVKVIAMDCDGFGRDICRKKYQIKSFPTMHFYYPKDNVLKNSNLNEYEEYEGPRDYETVTMMIKERIAEDYEYYNAKVEEEGGGIEIEEVDLKKEGRQPKEEEEEEEEEVHFKEEEKAAAAEIVEEEEEVEEEDEDEEYEMSAKEMRSSIQTKIANVGNPDSLLKILKYIEQVIQDDEQEWGDDFENVGKRGEL